MADDNDLIQTLQEALWRWLPCVGEDDTPENEQRAQDAYLLMGLRDNTSTQYGVAMEASLEQAEAEVARLREDAARLKTLLADALPPEKSAPQEAWEDWTDRFFTDGNGYVPAQTSKVCFGAFLLALGGHQEPASKAAISAALLAAHNELYRLHPPSNGRANDERELSLAWIKGLTE